MIVALNFIALPDTQAAGAYRYIARMLQMMQYYQLDNIVFHIYKQKHIPDEFFKIPENLKVTYINVPTLGRGIKRIVFEQTLFYYYIRPCDVFYSYCMSLPLLVHAHKIFTLHDVFGYSSAERYTFFRRIYIRLTTRMYIHSVDKIITVSTFSKQEIQHYLHVPDNKLFITYNFLLPEETRHHNISSQSHERPYFLYIGSLLPHKNIINMANGFVKFNIENKYELRIVGKLIDNQDTMLSHLKNLKNVKLLGYLPDDKIANLYANCVGVVLLSFCEGFGIPPIEGFSYGKPALVSNTASLPEVVGDAGIKVDPYNLDEIATGYHKIINQSSTLKHHIPEQLQKFNPYTSCETFMNTLGIKYEKI